MSATGGVPPLSYSIFSGPGSVSSAGLYSVPLNSGISLLRATDAIGNAATTTIQNLALRVNGKVNASYYSGGFWYLGGNFSSVYPSSGVIDTTFSPVGAATNGFATGGGRSVRAIAVSGSSLYVGGYFNDYRGVVDSANRVAKLDLTTGAIDTTFSPVGATANGFQGIVYSLGVANSSLYVGGSFWEYKGTSVTYFTKLDLTTGTMDTAFNPAGSGLNTYVTHFGFSSNSLLIGGGDASTTYRGTRSPFFSILNPTTGEIQGF